jgi:aromatic-L-amino-acid decarboxylase
MDGLPAGAPPGPRPPTDPAATARIGDALRRLAPALDRYVAHEGALPAPAYRAGTVPSEAADLPEKGAGLDTVLDELAIAVEAGCRISAPGASCYINTGATTAPAAAAAAVAVAGGQRYYLHAFNALESTGLRWLAALCDLPPGVEGVFTSGGSSANLVALGAARQHAFEQRGVDVGRDGLPAGARARIYASRHAHRTIHRAVAVLGLGRAAVFDVPDDGRGHVDPAALDARMQADARDGIVPVAVVGIAGTTDTGAVDPLAQLAEIAHRHGSWLHVDGAYGLIAAASPALRPRLAGMRDADSWVVDPHKWLATGLGVGCAFVRDGALLERAFMEGHAAYLEGSFVDDGQRLSQFDAFGGRWADLGVELSAPPRGVLVWAVLREIGRRGVVERVERHAGYARRLAARVAAEPSLELGAEPELSIACFRHRFTGRDEDAANAVLLQRLRRETPYVPSSTIVGGRFMLRSCAINPRTAPEDVDGLVDAVLALARTMG